MLAQHGAMGGDDPVDDGAVRRGELSLCGKESIQRLDGVGADGDGVAIVKNGISERFHGGRTAQLFEQIGLEQLWTRRLRHGGCRGRGTVPHCLRLAAFERNTWKLRQRVLDRLTAARLEGARADDGMGGRRHNGNGFAEIGAELVEHLCGEYLTMQWGRNGKLRLHGGGRDGD